MLTTERCKGCDGEVFSARLPGGLEKTKREDGNGKRGESRRLKGDYIRYLRTQIGHRTLRYGHHFAEDQTSQRSS